MCVYALTKLYTLNSAVHCTAFMPQLSYKNIILTFTYLSALESPLKGRVNLSLNEYNDPRMYHRSQETSASLRGYEVVYQWCVNRRSPGETNTAALGTTNTQSTIFLGVIRYFLRKAKHKVHSSEGRARAGDSLDDQTCRGPCFLDQEVVQVCRCRADAKAPASSSVSLQPLHGRCFPNT